MELDPNRNAPPARIRWKNTCRLIPSRYPTEGVLDRIANPRDLPFIFELESWTNDRISNELGVLNCLPREEWITGAQSTVVMAAFCHPRPGGGRFNGSARGAWYAARDLASAQAEIVYHRSRELAEVGVFDTRVEMRLYLADISGTFHDVRGIPGVHDPESYTESQKLAARLLDAGSNGVVYRSVRRPGGECIACFRPRLVANVRPDAHFEYRWEGGPVPVVRTLPLT